MISTKLKASGFAGLLFYVISNPITYTIVDSLLGGLLGTKIAINGKPTGVGLIVHSVVFAGITYLLMCL